MHMVFQDPYSSLNPRMKVADIVAAPLRAQRHLRPTSRRKLNAEVDEMLAQVGLSAQLRGSYRMNYPAVSGSGSGWRGP